MPRWKRITSGTKRRSANEQAVFYRARRVASSSSHAPVDSRSQYNVFLKGERISAEENKLRYSVLPEDMERFKPEETEEHKGHIVGGNSSRNQSRSAAYP